MSSSPQFCFSPAYEFIADNFRIGPVHMSMVFVPVLLPGMSGTTRTADPDPADTESTGWNHLGWAHSPVGVRCSLVARSTAVGQRAAVQSLADTGSAADYTESYLHNNAVKIHQKTSHNPARHMWSVDMSILHDLVVMCGRIPLASGTSYCCLDCFGPSYP